MVNAIITLILVIVLIFATKSSIKHFKGEGACCGGGSGTVKRSKPKKKKLNGPVIAHYTIEISGMHCQNCVNGVTRAINAIDGAAELRQRCDESDQCYRRCRSQSQSEKKQCRCVLRP